MVAWTVVSTLLVAASAATCASDQSCAAPPPSGGEQLLQRSRIPPLRKAAFEDADFDSLAVRQPPKVVSTRKTPTDESRPQIVDFQNPPVGSLATDASHGGLFIAYISGVQNKDRRDQVRNTCIPKLSGTPYRFFIGQPSAPGDPLNKDPSLASLEEVNLAQSLNSEQTKYGDLHMVPMLDSYHALSEKVISVFTQTLRWSFDLVLKIDDDMCPNITALNPLLAASKPDVALYGGVILHDGVVGADTTVVPYFGGPCYVLSKTLSSIIFDDNAFDTHLYQLYGNMFEDSNMGRWVRRANLSSLNGNVTFLRNVSSDMCQPYDKHSAHVVNDGMKPL